MMTYDQAKVFECVRTGIGATYGEIMRLLQWDKERVIKALFVHQQYEWMNMHMADATVYFQATSKGEEAYQKWADLPF